MDLIVRDPPVRGTFHTRERHPKQQPRAATPQQIIVELAASDAVAYGFAIVRFNGPTGYTADPKTRDWLQQVFPGVFAGINGQAGKNHRRDPSAADLVPREYLLIENDHVQTGAAQLPRARRTGRAAPDDQDVACVHFGSPSPARLTICIDWPQPVWERFFGTSKYRQSRSEKELQRAGPEEPAIDPARYSLQALWNQGSYISETRWPAVSNRSIQCSKVLA